MQVMTRTGICFRTIRADDASSPVRVGEGLSGGFLTKLFVIKLE